MVATPDTPFAIAGIGYGFKTGSTLEANLRANNVNNTKDFEGTVAATVASDAFYMGIAYKFLNLAHQHLGFARLGFIIGKSFDFSLHAAAPFVSGANLTYGGSVRFAF